MQEALQNFSTAAEQTRALLLDFSNGFFDLQDSVGSLKDEYNELKWVWNGCLISSVIITGTISLLSLVWPLLAAANTRRNLQTGKWRQNKSGKLCPHTIRSSWYYVWSCYC